MQHNSPGSDITVLANVYAAAKGCRHLAQAIVPPSVYLKEAQYRVTLMGYGPPANPEWVQVQICYMLSWGTQS